MLFMLASLLVAAHASCLHYQQYELNQCSYDSGLGESAKFWCDSKGLMHINVFTSLDCTGVAAVNQTVNCTSNPSQSCSCSGASCSAAEITYSTCGSTTTTISDQFLALGQCVYGSSTSSFMYWCDGANGLVLTNYGTSDCSAFQSNTKMVANGCQNGYQYTISGCSASTECQHYSYYPAGVCQYTGADSFEYWCDSNDNMYYSLFSSSDCSGPATLNSTTDCLGTGYDCSCAGGTACGSFELVYSSCGTNTAYGAVGTTITDYSYVVDECIMISSSESVKYACIDAFDVDYYLYSTADCSGDAVITSFSGSGCVSGYEYAVTNCHGKGASIHILSLGLLFSMVFFWSIN